VHNAPPSDPEYEVPIFEDSRSVLLGIRELVQADLHGKLDPRQSTRMLYAYQIAASIVNRPDAMSPHALQQLERRQAEEAKQQAATRKARSAPDKEEPAPRITLADHLAESMSKRLGIAIDLDCKHLPPEQRPSRNQALLDVIDAHSIPKSTT
jgi:hypothetical protein